MTMSLRSIGLIAFAAICGGLSCESPLAPTPNTSIGLRVWVDVAPRTLSMSDSTATIRIRIYAENPTANTLRIRSGGQPYVFTWNPAQSQGLAGSFRIASATDPLKAGPESDFWGESVYVFAPHAVLSNEEVVSMRDRRSHVPSSLSDPQGHDSQALISDGAHVTRLAHPRHGPGRRVVVPSAAQAEIGLTTTAPT